MIENIIDKSKIANFYLPDFTIGYKLYKLIEYMMEDTPDLLRPNTRVLGVFGNFPYCTWNGGRADTKLLPPFSRQRVRDLAEDYQSRNIPLQLTMTNTMLTEEDLSDRYSNMILEECSGRGFHVKATMPFVEDYIKSKYKFKFVKSILSTSRDMDPLSNIDKYHRLVIPKEFNTDFNYLNSIPMDKREKIELLVNEYCYKGCTHHNEHWDLVSRMIVYDKSLLDKNISTKCIYDKKVSCGEYVRTHYEGCWTIDRETLDNVYVPLGFNNFKLQGRGDIGYLLTNLTEYIVSPKYHKILICKFIDDLVRDPAITAALNNYL